MRYKKSEISVAQIVDATIRVLARQGYARTSLMDIAKEVGMSKGAVHYHFPTKEALMGVVLQAACEMVATRTLSSWTEGDNPRETLRGTLQALWQARAELSDEAKVVADLLAQSLHEEKLREPLAEYYRFAAAQVAEYMLPELDRLGIKPRMDPAKIPRLLNALLDGMLMQRIVDPEGMSDEEVVESLIGIAEAIFDFNEG